MLRAKKGIVAKERAARAKNEIWITRHTAGLGAGPSSDSEHHVSYCKVLSNAANAAMVKMASALIDINIEESMRIRLNWHSVGARLVAEAKPMPTRRTKSHTMGTGELRWATTVAHNAAEAAMRSSRPDAEQEQAHLRGADAAKENAAAAPLGGVAGCAMAASVTRARFGGASGCWIVISRAPSSRTAAAAR